MNKTGLFLRFIGRSITLGLISGAVVGTGNYLILFLIPSIYLLVYLICGALLGGFIGAFNGLVLGALSLTRYYEGIDETGYRNAMFLNSVTITCIFTGVFFHLVFSFYSATGQYNMLLLVMAVVLAAVASVWASNNLSRWYLEQLIPSQLENQSQAAPNLEA